MLSQAVARHPLLELSLPVEAEMLPMWSEQTVTLGDGLSNHMHWTYSLVGDVRAPEQTLHRELWVRVAAFITTITPNDFVVIVYRTMAQLIVTMLQAGQIN